MDLQSRFCSFDYFFWVFLHFSIYSESLIFTFPFIFLLEKSSFLLFPPFFIQSIDKMTNIKEKIIGFPKKITTATKNIDRINRNIDIFHTKRTINTQKKTAKRWQISIKLILIWFTVCGIKMYTRILSAHMANIKYWKSTCATVANWFVSCSIHTHVIHAEHILVTSELKFQYFLTLAAFVHCCSLFSVSLFPPEPAENEAFYPFSFIFICSSIGWINPRAFHRLHLQEEVFSFSIRWLVYF